MIKLVSEQGTKRDVIFAATTGHELSHLGLDFFLVQAEELVRSAHMWIHLGANFAAKQPPAIRLQFSDDAARQSLQSILQRKALTPATTTPRGQRPGGEARNIHDGGGRYISILASNPLFHHPADIWPDAVDLAQTTGWIEAFCDLALQLANEPASTHS